MTNREAWVSLAVFGAPRIQKTNELLLNAGVMGDIALEVTEGKQEGASQGYVTVD